MPATHDRPIAILYEHPDWFRPLFAELERRNVPFVKFGGLKFLEAAHIKDVVSVLRWAENPRNRLSGYRASLLVAGFGPATVRRLLDEMDAALQPAQVFAAFAPPAAAREDWAQLRNLMAQLRTHSDAWPDDLRRVHRWYLPQLERLYDDARVRQADLTQLERIAEGFRNRERFLTELALDPPQATSDEAGDPHLDEDYLILSTIHSAKGQEWQSVHVLNVVDGCIPADLMTGSSNLIEEERRLLYVAMTRARLQLHLLVPQRFYLSQQSAGGDRHVYASVSRFIPPAIAQLFDPIGAQRPDVDSRLAPPTPNVAQVDVAAAIRSSWG